MERFSIMKELNNLLKVKYICLIFLLSNCNKKEVALIETNENIILESENLINNTDSVALNDVKILDAKTASTIKISYLGKIDKFPIEMEIVINKTTKKIEGNYRYKKNKNQESIFINGEINNNIIILNEKILENGNWIKTGTFELNLNNFKNISGTWINAKNNKALQVNLSSLENFENKPLTFTFEADLKTIFKERFPESDDKIEETELQSLKIFHQNKLIQTISNLNSIILDNAILVEIEDLNFDGYFDLKVLEYFSDRTKYDVGYRYFIYNKETKQFELNSELNDLEYLTFNSFTKEFTKMYADGRGNESTYYYKWKQNSFKLVKKEETFEDNSEVEITNYTY